MIETWKPIEGYEGLYQISSLGVIKALPRKTSHNHLLPERVIKGCKATTGYWQIVLWKDGVNKIKMLHQLLAIAFIPNPKGRHQVNHKNGNKIDNRLENLEWCTPSENLKHAYDVLNRPTNFKGKSFVAIPIVQKTKEGQIVRQWSCCAEAARHYNVNASSINNVVLGRKKSVKGFKWEKL